MKKMRELLLVLLVCSLFLTGCGSGLRAVIERTGLSKDEIANIYEQAESSLAKGSYEDAIKGYLTILGYKDSEETLRVAKADYVAETVDEAYELANTDGKFDDALKHIDAARDVVGENDTLDEAERSVIVSYKKSVIAIADGYVNEDNYDVALSILNDLTARIGVDNEVTEKVAAVEDAKLQFIKDAAMETIATFDAQEEKTTAAYGEMFAYVDEQLALVKDDAELLGKLEEYRAAYRNAILVDAEAAYQQSGYEAGVLAVSTGLSVLPDDVELKAAFAKYQDLKPVPLSDFDYFDLRPLKGWSRAEHFVESSMTDNVGEKHSDVHAGHGELIYLINGYSKLTGCLFQFHSYRTEDDITTLEIYGNGVLLHSATMTAGKKPLDFSADISGIEELRIRIDCGTDGAPWQHEIAGVGDLMLHK